MNFNTEIPKERGYWYDVLVKQIIVNRRNREVIGNVTIGSNRAVLNNCHLKFVDDIFKIKPYKLVAERTAEEDTIMQTKPSTESKKLTAMSLVKKILNKCFFFREKELQL